MPMAPQQIPSSQSSPSWDDFMGFMQQYTVGSDGGGFGSPFGGLEAFFASLYGDDDADSFVLEGPGFPEIAQQDDRFAKMGERLSQSLKEAREMKQQKGVQEGERRIQAVPSLQKPQIQQPPQVTPSLRQTPSLQTPSLQPSPQPTPSPQIPQQPSGRPLDVPKLYTPPPPIKRAPAKPGVSFGKQMPPTKAYEYWKNLSPQGQAFINEMRLKAGKKPFTM